MLRAVIFFLMMAGPAFAGAWPRGKGNVFMTFSAYGTAMHDLAGSAYGGLYLEYGLSDKLTMGVDAGHGVSGLSKTIIFLSYPILSTENGHRFAAELGMGEIAGDPVLRPGLSYGRGFSTKGGKSGWVSVDTVAEIRLLSGLTDYKADLTLGLNRNNRIKHIFQLQLGASAGEPLFARAVPSVVIGLGKTSHFEIGLTAPLSGHDKNLGLKLAFWRAF